jgi:uncharacterized small protein (DUF1192 family)
MSKHHKNCKWKNYTSVEFLPCPFCRIEELTERLTKLGKEYSDYVEQSVKNELYLDGEIERLKAENYDIKEYLQQVDDLEKRITQLDSENKMLKNNTEGVFMRKCCLEGIARKALKEIN